MKRVPPSRLVPRSFLFALIGAFLLQSCANAPSSTTPDEPSAASATTRPGLSTESHVVIFHSNDVHGKIDNFAKVAALLDAERKTGADVFYFSAGDNFTGAPVIDRADPQGGPIQELLERLGLDVLCPGNHEFDYGMGSLRRLAARFSTVSANIDARPGTFPELKPWVVLKAKSGIKIVVFGLIQIEPGNRLPSTHPDKVKDLAFSEPLSKVRDLKKLRASGEVLVGLTHIGYEQDLILAREMPEIDVIIGGHSHTRVDPAETVNGVLLTQAGSDNRFLGRVDLRLKGGRVVEKTGRLIDLSKVAEEDETIKAMIVKYHQNPELDRVIARAPIEISGKNALGSLMADAVRQAHGLDFAFQNNGGIRLSRLPQTIRLRDAYTLEPFGNLIVQFAMTAAEIRSLIRGSCERQGEIDLQVAGMSYTVRAGRDKKITSIELRLPDGSPLLEDRTYSVGLSSYIASSYRFDHKDPGRSLQTTVADDLIQYLQSGVDLGIYRDIQRAFWETAAGTSRN